MASYFVARDCFFWWPIVFSSLRTHSRRCFHCLERIFHEYTSTGNALVKRGGWDAWTERRRGILWFPFSSTSLSRFSLFLSSLRWLGRNHSHRVRIFPSEFPLPLLCLSRLLSYLVETDSSLEIYSDTDRNTDIQTDITEHDRTEPFYLEYLPFYTKVFLGLWSETMNN